MAAKTGKSAPQIGTQPSRTYLTRTQAKFVANVIHAIALMGIERVGFLTLTFRWALDPKEASARVERFMRECGRKWISHWVKVPDHSKKGSVHFHFLVVCKENIADGTDLALVEALRDDVSFKTLTPAAKRPPRNQTSQNEALHEIWEQLDTSLPKLQFGGQYDFFPLFNLGGVSCYLRDKLKRTKHARKGSNLVSYSAGFPRVTAPPKVRSPWFQNATDCILRACGKQEESYFASQYETRKWHYMIILIARSLDSVKSGWNSLSPSALANYLVAFASNTFVGDYCKPIFLDLLRTAGKTCDHEESSQAENIGFAESVPDTLAVEGIRKNPLTPRLPPDENRRSRNYKTILQ